LLVYYKVKEPVFLWDVNRSLHREKGGAGEKSDSGKGGSDGFDLMRGQNRRAIDCGGRPLGKASHHSSFGWARGTQCLQG